MRFEPVFQGVVHAEDERLPDGSVRKVAVFRHAGFVPALTQEKKFTSHLDE